MRVKVIEQKTLPEVAPQVDLGLVLAGTLSVQRSEEPVWSDDNFSAFTISRTVDMIESDRIFLTATYWHVYGVYEDIEVENGSTRIIIDKPYDELPPRNATTCIIKDDDGKTIYASDVVHFLNNTNGLHALELVNPIHLPTEEYTVYIIATRTRTLVPSIEGEEIAVDWQGRLFLSADIKSVIESTVRYYTPQSRINTMRINQENRHIFSNEILDRLEFEKCFFINTSNDVPINEILYKSNLYDYYHVNTDLTSDIMKQVVIEKEFYATYEYPLTRTDFDWLTIDEFVGWVGKPPDKQIHVPFIEYQLDQLVKGIGPEDTPAQVDYVPSILK